MNCRHVQPLVSARMDGEHLSSVQRDGVETHLAGCASCRTFEERSTRVRTAVRIRPAEQVPDLTEAIMAGVATEAARGARRLGRRPKPHRSLMPAIAAAIAGMLVGSLVVGGPWRDGPDIASAASIAHAIRQVAPSVDAFRASYVIDEHGLDPAVPDRQLQMDVAFLAPQRFRLDVRDLTTYPSKAWTPTDLTYIEDMPATYQSGPTGCPAALAAECPTSRTIISHTSAFSAAAPLPADLIAPIATFGSADGVTVVGREDVDGHDTVRTEMSFARAAPLFPFLRLGGTWRPMFEGDRVVLWLDTTGWYPVRFEVFPSTDPERRAWEMRFGLPHEQAETAIMDVRLQSVSTEPPDPSLFAIPDLDGSANVPLEDAGRRLGYTPAIPGDAGHLDLASLIAPSGEGPAAPSSVLVYAAGLDYLRISEDPTWRGPGPFGPLDATAQAVDMAGGGVALYAPAGDGLGRRLAIHAAGTDLFLETNLPRDELLSIAATLPVRVEALPASWRSARAGPLTIERIPTAEALADAGLSSVPAGLPAGYVIASATRTLDRGAAVATTVTFRQRETDAAGPPITLHVSRSPARSHTTAPDQVLVAIGATTGRWTPSDALLEWEAGGSTRSLQGDVGLEVLLDIAASLTKAAP